MKNKSLIIGGIFELIAPFVGIFLGLQVSPLLGNIFAFPFIIISYISGQSLGNWSYILFLIATILSIIIWSLIFYLLKRIISLNKLF